MTVVAGDILRTTVNFALGDGSQYQNVFHHQRTGIAIIGDPSHVSTLKAWAEAMYAELVDIVKNNVVEQLSFVDKVDWSGTAWEVVENIGTFTPTFAPTAVGDALPNQVSPFVVFKTARPKSVGRKFLFPLTEAEQDAGIMIAGAVAAIVQWADDAVNDVTLTAGNFLVPGIPRTGVDSWLEFTVAIVTDLVGTQRRRRPGTGS